MKDLKWALFSVFFFFVMCMERVGFVGDAHRNEMTDCLQCTGVRLGQIDFSFLGFGPRSFTLVSHGPLIMGPIAMYYQPQVSWHK